MVDPYNYSTKEDNSYLQEDWYKELKKGIMNDLKEKFGRHYAINRKLSDTEFNEMYEDYRDSGLDYDAYLKARKYR